MSAPPLKRRRCHTTTASSPRCSSSSSAVPWPLPPAQQQTPAPAPRVASLDKAEMQVASDVTQLIGNTPMVYLNRIGKGLPARVAAKVSERENETKSGARRPPRGPRLRAAPSAAKEAALLLLP